jgi:hypothetical protein
MIYWGLQNVKEVGHTREIPYGYITTGFAPRVGLEPPSRLCRDNSRELQSDLTMDEPFNHQFAFPGFDLAFCFLRKML